MSELPKISERELKALNVLADFYDHEGNCLYFRTIAEKTRMNISQTRRSVRSLARKGLAEYVRGLFSDDGAVAGSGYCCTREGYHAREALAKASPSSPEQTK
jgi:hypothetical protein